MRGEELKGSRGKQMGQLRHGRRTLDAFSLSTIGKSRNIRFGTGTRRAISLASSPSMSLALRYDARPCAEARVPRERYRRSCRTRGHGHEALQGFCMGRVEVEAAFGVALGGAEELPIGGLLDGIGVALRIGKTLGQERLIAEYLQLLGWRGPEGHAHGL